MRRAFLFLTMVFSVLMLTSVAFGQDAYPCPPVDVTVALADQAQMWWMVLIDAIVQLVFPVIGVVLVALAQAGLKKWFAKLEKEGRMIELQTQESIFRAVDGLVTGGLSFAEEQARKALKVDKVKTEGAAKMQIAVDFVMENLETSRLPEIGREELVRLIESRLNQERVDPNGVVENTSPVIPF